MNIASPALPAPFVIREYVRWGDVDYAGIIRYDAYTRFMELAESEMFRALGITYGDFGTKFDFQIPRRAMHMDFESAPTLDDLLEVHTYVSNVGTTSLTLNFDVYEGTGAGARRAAGYLVLVCVQHGMMRSRPWSPEFLSLINPRRLSVDEARAWQQTGAR
jgi:YbgC/YbaW family acyl-CoA thioester hydrolase